MSVTLTAARGPRRAEKLAYLAYQIRRSPLTMAGLLITSIVLLCMIFAPWLAEQGFDVEISDTLDAYLDAGKMKGLSLVVQVVTMSRITPQQEKGLLDAVKSGVGLAGWHGGLSDSFRNNTEYEFMVGGAWAAHPGAL